MPRSLESLTTLDATESPDGSAEASRSSRSVPVAALDDRLVRVRDVLPIATIHLLALAAIWTSWSPAALVVAAALFIVRMFAITAFYHRYFSHRTFRTHRVTQFLFAYLGTTSAQRGPLWWAAHHRQHHRHADDHPDPHSPWWKGVLWSHTGWFLTPRGRATDWRVIPDWARYPELVWLERYHLVGPLGLVAFLAALGAVLQHMLPVAGVTPWQLVVWGFGVSTALLYHATFTINSLAHTVGSRRFRTPDDSRNNFFLALITLGEGWHNNHHYYPGTARQGFYWWEIDPTYWTLRALSWIGVVWNLRPVPQRVYDAAREHAGLNSREPAQPHSPHRGEA